MDSTKIVQSEAPPSSKGKLLSLWAKCVVNPSELLGSSIARSLRHFDVKRLNFASKCLKCLPEMSLSCQFSASFSLSSAAKTENSNSQESLERCRKIVRIEDEIRTLERRLGTRRF